MLNHVYLPSSELKRFRPFIPQRDIRCQRIDSREDPNAFSW